MIEVERLSKTFAYHTKKEGLLGSIGNLFHRPTLHKQAVGEVSFRIEGGEIVGLLGPNGAGKSTLIKMLSGILYPTSGSARVAGYVPWERALAFRRSIGIVMGQRSQLWPDLPAMDSYLLNQRIYDVEETAFRRVIGELSELLDVRRLLDIQVRRLSLGERIKLDLIGALLHSPRVVFLDEPTIGLDFAAQKSIRGFIRDYCDRFGATIVLTSHYSTDIEDLCRRVIVTHHGKLLYDGELARIADRFSFAKIVRFRARSPAAAVALPFDYALQEKADGEYWIEARSEHVNEVIRVLLDRLEVEDLRIEHLPLERSIESLYVG